MKVPECVLLFRWAGPGLMAVGRSGALVASPPCLLAAPHFLA